MKLSDIDLSEEEIAAFRWCMNTLIEQHRQAVWEAENERERDALSARRAEKLVSIARQWADEHGPIPWMLTGYQATAAWESWMEEAGYLDVDEHFQPDDDDQDLWETTYRLRIDELRQARAS